MNKSIKWLLALLCLTACVKQPLLEDAAVLEDGEPLPDVPYITAILPGADSKTVCAYSDLTLRLLWAYGDEVSIVPNGYDYRHAGVYALPYDAPERTYARFVQKTAVSATGNFYTAIHPGRLKSYAQFSQFTYDGQCQRKSAVMAHLMNYNSMLVDNLTSYSQVDFSSSVRSSCMRFNLTGMKFKNPSRITLLCPGSGDPVFVLNNVPPNTVHFTSEAFRSPEKVAELSLDLEGYGEEETQIIAYMMMSNAPVSLPAGATVRVKVECSDGVWYSDTILEAAMTLSSGYCHRLTVDSGWVRSTADYTKYSWDGEVVTLNTSSYPNLAVVAMGDGFVAQDFDDGTYDKAMKMAIDQFFYHEPLRSYRNDFNIHYVKVPSPERLDAVNTGANGARNIGSETALNVKFTPNSTSMSGNHQKAMAYASKAVGDAAMENITILVVANQHCHAGTCHNFFYTSSTLDYGYGMAVAYCGLGTSEIGGKRVVRHEGAGHGFGKLADEYVYTVNQYSQAVWSELETMHGIGMYRNVDKYVDSYIYGKWGSSLPGLALTTSANVAWADMFGTRNNYESSGVEALGVYQGGYTRNLDCCRPISVGSRSVMSGNSGVFNAVCRRQILYRIKQLRGDYSGSMYGSATELGAFLDWDATNFIPYINQQIESSSTVMPDSDRASAPSAVMPSTVIPSSVMPDPDRASDPAHTPPVNHAGRWVPGQGLVME